MTKEEAYNKIEQTIEEYFEFVSLVKRMRDAQKERKRFPFKQDYFFDRGRYTHPSKFHKKDNES